MFEPAHELAASRRMLVAEDVDLIQMLAGRLRLMPSVIDLGAGSGTTALAVLAVRPFAQITSVDIDQGALDWAEKAVGIYRDADWLGIRAKSWEAAVLRSRFSAPVDLLLVDASHEREDVERDLTAWLPLMRSGGLVWLHDFAPPPSKWRQPASPGVARAILTFTAAGLLEPLEARGLGWAGTYTGRIVGMSCEQLT